jgi:hypothetical protein
MGQLWISVECRQVIPAYPKASRAHQRLVGMGVWVFGLRGGAQPPDQHAQGGFHDQVEGGCGSVGRAVKVVVSKVF